jgi:hypothetical protein
LAGQATQAQLGLLQDGAAALHKAVKHGQRPDALLQLYGGSCISTCHTCPKLASCPLAATSYRGSVQRHACTSATSIWP